MTPFKFAFPKEKVEQKHAALKAKEEQLRQLQKWRELVRFEKDQSEATGTSVRLRVRHTYKQALCSLRYFPELWYEFAMEELESRDIDASLQVLATGCAVLDSDGQGCLVLQFSRASLLFNSMSSFSVFSFSVSTSSTFSSSAFSSSNIWTS